MSGTLTRTVNSTPAVFGGLYYAQLQYAGSLTDTSAGARYGRMWEGVVDRTGREFGFHYSLKGFSPDFVTQTGFVSRTNIVDVSANNRFTWFGARGARLESLTSFLTLQSIWTYGDFWRGQTPLEAKASMSTTAAIRGGWSFGLTPVLYTAVRAGASNSIWWASMGRLSGQEKSDQNSSFDKNNQTHRQVYKKWPRSG